MERLKDYIIDIDTRYIENDIREKGIDDALEYKYKLLDCTRTFPNGLRIIQTIDYTYKSIISEFNYVFENYDKSVKDAWLEKVVQRHLDNLEYEKVFTNTVYKKKGKTKTVRKTKSKDEVKTTKASQKLKETVSKLNKLSFKIQ